MNNLKALLLFLSIITIPLSNVQASKKNVLILNVDDLKPALGYYGDEHAKTPHINNLASRGTAFLMNYCQKAVCAPSRVSMMTGVRPDSTGILDLHTYMRDINPDIITLPQYLRTHGYKSVGYGKILHGAKDDDPVSWDERYKDDDLKYSESTQEPAVYKFQTAEVKEEYKELIAKFKKGKWIPQGKIMKELKKLNLYPATECFDLPDDAYPDGAMVNAGIARLSQFAETGESFIMTLGFRKPHLPFNAPKKYWDLYDRNAFTLSPSRGKPEGAPKQAMHTYGELGAYTGYETGVPVPENKERELIHAYYACVSYVDAQIGKVMKALDEMGLAEKTIIVLWGDHGYHLGDHGLWCKHSNFEQATGTPLLIVDPSKKSNQKTYSPTELIDIYPTVCELLGLPIPEQVQGSSLVPVMEDPSVKVKDFSVSQYRRHAHDGYSIRTERYRLTFWMKKGFYSFLPYEENMLDYVELYDYQMDPHELKNQSDNPEYVAVLNEMKQHMLDFFKKSENPELAAYMPQLIAEKSRKFKKKK